MKTIDKSSLTRILMFFIGTLVFCVAESAEAGTPIPILPTSVIEGAGVLTNAGQINMGSVATSNVVVTLSSSDPILMVPTSVTIQQGQSNVFFDLTVGDNAEVDGNRVVTIGATAAGTLRSTNVTVFDNESLHFVFSRIASPRYASVPFLVSITATDTNGVCQTNFSSFTGLIAAGTNGSVPLQPAVTGFFSNGVWTGMIQCLATDQFVQIQTIAAPGISVPFHVADKPFRAVNLQAQQLIWDAGRKLLYASVPSVDASYPDSVTAIDPSTGTIVFSVPVGTITRPATTVEYRSGCMALSDDGQFLYVAVNNALSVQQVNLATRTAGSVFSVGTGSTGNTLSAADLVVLAGAPTSVAVARADGFNARGVAIYDNGIRRPNTTPEFAVSDINVLEPWGSGTNLLGYNNQNTGFDFSRIAIMPTGPVILDQTSGLFNGFSADITYSGGLVFGSFGGVVDPAVPSLVGQFTVESSYPACCKYVAPDPAIGRAFFLSTVVTNYHLQADDLATFMRLKSVEVPGDGGFTQGVVRWGTNGLAFASTAGMIYLVQSPLLFSEGPAAEIAVTQSNSPALIGTNLTITVSVTNAGPALATDLVLTNALPSGVTLVSSTVSQGDCVTNQTGVTGYFGMLPAGSTATLTLIVRPDVGGWMTNSAVAIANEADSNLTNNVSVTNFFAGFSDSANTVCQINLPSWDLAYASNNGMLYLSVPGTGLVPVNPQAGAFGAPVLAGEDPRKLAVSADSSFLYAATRTNHNISRLTLPSATLDQSFPLSLTTPNTTAEDLEVPSDQPGSIIVLRTPDGFNAEVAVYDNGVVRTNVAATQSDAYPETLELADGLSMAFVQNDGVGGLWRYALDAGGATLLDTDTSLNPLLTGVDIEWGNGLLYTTLGRVIDPIHHLIVGQIPAITNSSLEKYDAASRRLYYLTSAGGTNVILCIDPSTYAVLGILNVPNVSGTPSSLIRWGTDGLAFRTSAGQLFILRTSMVPSGPTTDLALTALVSTNIVVTNTDFTYTLMVTNGGPNAASNTVVLDKLPTGVTFISGLSPGGAVTLSNGVVRCSLGTLTNGQTTTVQITARATVAGIMNNLATVVSDAIESNPDNNSSATSIQAIFVLKPNSVGQVALPARDIAYNGFTSQLYLSGGSNGTNAISLLDPLTGATEGFWPLPSKPGLLRLSSDGTLLYCSLNSDNDVGRVNTTTGQLDFDFAAGAVINELAIMPGAPTSYALAQTASFGIVQIYDGMVARGTGLYDSAGARTLQFGGTADQLYGVGRALSGLGRYRVLTVSGSGLVETAWNESYPSNLGKLSFQGGRLYVSTGEILDPPTGSVLDRFSGPTSSSLVAPDLDHQRVFFLNKSNSTWRVQAYEPTTTALLGSMTVSNVLGNPLTLLRWSEDGLAFCTSSNQLFLLRTSLAPSGNPADLSVTQAALAAPVMVGSNITFTVTVSNAGPNNVTNVTLVDRFPTNTTFVSNSISQGTAVRTNGLLTCSLGTLTNGATAQLTLTLRASVAGKVSNVAAVTGPQADPLLSNNSSALSVPVLMSVNADQFGVINFAVLDLVYEPVSGLLYATASNSPGVYSNSIVAIDPATGAVQDPLYIGEQLSKLAVTDDGTKLYALSSQGKQFLRIDLATKAVELQVAFSNSTAQSGTYATSLKAVPGQPLSAAFVLQYPGVLGGSPTFVVYDNSSPRATATTLGQRAVEFYSPDHILGYDWQMVPSQSTRFALTTTGVVALASASYLVDGDMSASGGLIYTSNGGQFDPETLTKIRSFGVTGPVAPDAAIDRVAFLTGSSSTLALQIFDTHEVFQWGSLTVSNVVGAPDRLIRCGSDRYAFRTTGGQVFIVRHSAVPVGHPQRITTTLLNGSNLGTNPAQLQVIAPHGGNYTLQTSTNLVDWTDIINFSPTTCSTLITNSTISLERCFFRVKPQ